MELDQPREREREREQSLSSQKENRCTPAPPPGLKVEKKGERKSSVDKAPTLPGTQTPTKDGGVTYSLGQVGAASTAIANSKVSLW